MEIGNDSQSQEIALYLLQVWISDIRLTKTSKVFENPTGETDYTEIYFVFKV